MSNVEIVDLGDDYRQQALDNLDGERRMRATAEQRWGQVIAAALVMGNSIEDVAECAGLGVDEVRALADEAMRPGRAPVHPPPLRHHWRPARESA